jgi:GR25 family glycosyltransferase involved in LPS biosynthesis
MILLVIFISIIILFQIEYNKPFIKINVINLNRAFLRNVSTSLQLYLNGVSFSRYPAIDGSTYKFTDSELEMFSELIQQNKDKMTSKKLNGVMACALSHINIWNVNINNGPILILEDDIIIYPQFKYSVNTVLKDIAITDPDWHIIWISGGDPGNREIVLDSGIHKIYRMDPPEYIGQGTVGYMLSKKGIDYFTKKIKMNGCSNGIDIYLLKNLDINHAYGVHSPLVGSGLFTSSITN